MRHTLSSLIFLITLLSLTITIYAIPSVTKCPALCSKNGECLASGICECKRGFTGSDCSLPCFNLCSNKGACTVNQTCICQPGYSGSDCSIAAQCPRSKTDHPELDCSGHGVCHLPTRTCICQQGYVGDDCSIDDGSCGAQRCSNHGTCRKGLCLCDVGYSGGHCEVASSCANNCTKQGMCIGNVCQCYPGYTGKDCSTKDPSICPKDCSGNGVCKDKKCICQVGYTGTDCSIQNGVQPFCMGNACSHRGTCKHNQCFCTPGYYGRTCEFAGCEGGCAHGTCLVGQCKCEPGWSGKDCNKTARCPEDCNGRGICIKGECNCDPYYTGLKCEKLTVKSAACPNDCSGNGVCHVGKCFCAAGFNGTDCSKSVQSCTKNCSGPERGKCRFGKCFCTTGFYGDACEFSQVCDSKCSAHGICHRGQCLCNPGWTGTNCDTEVTAAVKQQLLEHDLIVAVTSSTGRSQCGKTKCVNGLCVRNRCVCEAGWSGASCTTASPNAPSAKCSNDCVNGQCLFGQCVCHPGYSGATCKQPTFLPCPNDCSSNGICYLGVCECHPGFVGTDCSKPEPCPGLCENGVCVQGECHCLRGYNGTTCSDIVPDADLPARVPIVSCPSSCGLHGICLAGQCVCVAGYKGVLCDIPDLDFVIPASGTPTPANLQVAAVYGRKNCTSDCGPHGVCVGGICTCVMGWAGLNCMEVMDQPAKSARIRDLSMFKLPRTISPSSSTPAFIDASSAVHNAAHSMEPVPVYQSPAVMSIESSPASTTSQTQTLQASASQRTASTISPDDKTQTLADTQTITQSVPAQTDMANKVLEADSGKYHIPIHPVLFSFICFAGGLIVTFIFTFVLKFFMDKRSIETRKKQKMEELLQPAS